MLSLNTNGYRPARERLAILSQPFARRQNRGLSHDHRFSRLHLLPRLRPVSPVSEEKGPSLRHQQGSGAACEAAEISDIRKVTDDKCVEMMFREGCPQTPHSPRMIHARKCIRRTGSASHLALVVDWLRRSLKKCNRHQNKTAGFIDLSVEESGDFFRQRR
jgi:hypothetical protein